MTAFNYRAYNLELDVCSQEHGYWLDAGEDGRVRDIIEERVRGSPAPPPPKPPGAASSPN